MNKATQGHSQKTFQGWNCWGLDFGGLTLNLNKYFYTFLGFNSNNSFISVV